MSAALFRSRHNLRSRFSLWPLCTLWLNCFSWGRNMKARIGFGTVSDTASRGEYGDKGGPAMQAWFARVLTSEWEAVARVIPDEQALIEKTLIELCDGEG